LDGADIFGGFHLFLFCRNEKKALRPFHFTGNLHCGSHLHFVEDSQRSLVMPHPFKMSPSEDEVQMAVFTAKEINDTLPETTCNHKIECCKSGCPNMYYSEYLYLRVDYIEKMSKEGRLNLIVECLRRYLKQQNITDPKPCPLLNDTMCGAYSSRPYRCRTYGLIPDEEYTKMVESVAKDFKIDKEKIPLCAQCPNVKIKAEFAEKFPTGKLPVGKMPQDQAILKTTDIMIGMPVQMQAMGYGYLTFHDWHLLFELGMEWLESLSKLRTSLKDEQKEQFVQSLKKAHEAKGD